METLLNYELQNEVSKANFNTVKRIYTRPPFMKVVYNMFILVIMHAFPNVSGMKMIDIKFVISGGSRGGPPLFWVKNEEMTEGKKANRATKSRHPPPPPPT